MKWFKHETNAHADAKLRRLRIRYGLEGLGLYWYCLELIGQTVEPHNLTFELEHDAEVIADDLNIHVDHIQAMMMYMVDLGLFEQDGVVVKCLKMAIRADEYTQKSIRKAVLSGQTPDKLRLVSGQAPDKVPSNRKKERKKEKGFTPPTPQEVDAYINEKKYKVSFTGERFCDSYASQGWKKKGGQAVVDWKACVRTWVQNESKFTPAEMPYGAGGI